MKNVWIEWIFRFAEEDLFNGSHHEVVFGCLIQDEHGAVRSQVEMSTLTEPGKN